ncbi:type IV conjugative transfer system protein TraE [Sphingomonas sp. SUN039]|uniref:type IV conjugative transfer system protein TraE n=1 Tax=Sphingomonas sp. SUN039 TaxID=2937787 RepID=UPI0021648BD5|nr:type IV conjugative transfer system protein TraE [Sphingomonas sp. SUN039]UVO53802.1 type IV conjugative transfer system protein TraE [Sphingomonas sp. SUN039]
MELSYSHSQNQRVLKQRNMLVVTSLALAGLAAVLGVAASSRDREVVLQPVLHTPLTLSSAGVSREYLEAVTRDAAVLTLNRTPQSLDYWMKSVLEMVHPSAYGQVKADLMKIVDDQRGSSIAQFFTVESMKVDPEALTSEVTGVLHTMVGRQEVSATPKTFHYGWVYNGLSLKLVQFGMVEKVDPKKAVAS